MSMLEVHAVPSQNLFVGAQGEYNVRRICFDVKPFIDDFGSGVPVLLYSVPDESMVYPLSIEYVEDKVYWIPNSADTSQFGFGIIELRWYGTDGVLLGKPVTFVTYVAQSYMNISETPPDAYETWIESLAELGASVADTVNKGKAEIERYVQETVFDISSLSWNTLPNKPFERLGESLKVTDGTLDINVHEVSNIAGGNTLVIGF